MIQMINKLKKNQKGFTLVELIVVLVILAILAAFTIPAMLGFVNDAKAKAYMAEAREVKLAYQTAITDTINANKDSTDVTAVDGIFTENTISGVDSLIQKVQKQAITLLDGDISNGTKINDGIKYYVKVENGKAIEVGYEKGGYTIVVNDNGATSEKKELTIPTGTAHPTPTPSPSTP